MKGDRSKKRTSVSIEGIAPPISTWFTHAHTLALAAVTSTARASPSNAAAAARSASLARPTGAARGGEWIAGRVDRW